jgi:hypothetical protein
MENKTKNSLIFLGKSLMWSALLYATLMLLLNWDDITSKTKTAPASFTSAAEAPNAAKIAQRGVSIITLLSYFYCNIVSKR